MAAGLLFLLSRPSAQVSNAAGDGTRAFFPELIDKPDAVMYHISQKQGGCIVKETERRKRVSIVDVAQLAGVSQATASRVFDPKWEGKIRPATRSKVEAAAKTLGYYGTNALVRSLRGKSSGMVALVVGSTTGYFYLEVIMKFVHQLRAAGRQVLIFEAGPDENLESTIRQIHCYQVDAIIITAAVLSSTVVELFCDTQIPVVVFNRKMVDGNCSAVYCDGQRDAERAADFLMDHGHKRFSVISGDSNTSKESGRTKGFCQGVLQRGGEILSVISGDYLYESGYSIAKELLETERPDAIFCVEDTIAMGVIDAARECYSLRVPEDLSVMGFDYASVGRFHAYNLTTMKYPLTEMIQSTINIMERMIKRPEHYIYNVFDMSVAVRGSVRL